MTPPSRCAARVRVELELVGLPGKSLARDATRRLRLATQHDAPWAHMLMQPRIDLRVQKTRSYPCNQYVHVLGLHIYCLIDT